MLPIGLRSNSASNRFKWHRASVDNVEFDDQEAQSLSSGSHNHRVPQKI